MHPSACVESRTTHAIYVKAIPEAMALCERLQAQAIAGPVQLSPGTEDARQIQAMEIKKRHIQERSEIKDHVIRELLPTPIDNNDPSRPPPKVSSECGTEIEDLVSFRSSLLNAVFSFYAKIVSDDDQLFQQALENALPLATSSPPKNVR